MPGGADPDRYDVRPLIEEAALGRRVRELAAEIRAAAGPATPLHFVAVLTGAFMFVADLIRADPGPSTCDFIALSSYRDGTRPSGAVTLARDLTRDIAGRHVVIVEDIIDTGRTLLFLRETLLARHPASLRTVALLNKATRREVRVPVEHIGFDIDDRFVVGYGLDIAERFRHLPFIGVASARREDGCP